MQSNMVTDHFSGAYPLQSEPMKQEGILPAPGYSPSYYPFTGMLRKNEYSPLGEAPPGHQDYVQGPAMPIASYQPAYY
jgi:hypothetical protein